MELRTLGRTGLEVSALGFGCGSIGGLMVRGDPADQTRAVARAIEAGITYFDTAAQYGDGRSEENLGRVLTALGAWNRVVVGTKAGPRAADRADLSAAVVTSLQGSLRRLGRDSVDLLQLHTPTFSAEAQGDRNLFVGEVLAGVADGMRRVIAQGLARHVGFSGLGDAAASRQLIGSGVFETMQGYFNVLNPSAGFAGQSRGAQDFDGIIDDCAQAGVGVIAIRVLAAGAVTGSEQRAANAGDPGHMLVQGNDFAGDVRRAGGLSGLARDLGLESPLELSFRFVLAKQGVSTALLGFSDIDQLESGLHWAEKGPLPADGVRRVLELAGHA
jgi:aryl-alcohol dehydrogenase-like predicted oxidoreductase